MSFRQLLRSQLDVTASSRCWVLHAALPVFRATIDPRLVDDLATLFRRNRCVSCRLRLAPLLRSLWTPRPNVGLAGVSNTFCALFWCQFGPRLTRALVFLFFRNASMHMLSASESFFGRELRPKVLLDSCYFLAVFFGSKPLRMTRQTLRREDVNVFPKERGSLLRRHACQAFSGRFADLGSVRF